MLTSLKLAILALSRRVQFKGKARLLTLFGLGPGRVDLVPEGMNSVDCKYGITMATSNNRDIMFRTLFVHGQYTDDVVVALRNLLRPGDVFWDIGANYGYMSIAIDKIFEGDVRVFSFEPSPIVLPELRRNVELNRCRSVEIQEMCLTDRVGPLEFYVSSDHSWNATLLHDFAAAKGEDIEVEVRGSTIDECVKTLPPPSVIKLDVEGAEHFVIRGGREFLKRASVPIVVEFNRESFREANLTPDQFLDLFRDLGYEVYTLPRPLFGSYRWETLRKVADQRELPLMLDLVMLKPSPASSR